MATYYVCPVTGDDTLNDGLSTTTPFATLSKALSLVTSADDVVCRHTNTPDETPASSIVVPDVSGSSIIENGTICVIGVNSSWVEDGTSYVLDGSLIADRILYTYGALREYRNLKFTNSQYDGVLGASSTNNNTFINCQFTNNGNYGFGGNSSGGSHQFVNCLFENNGTGCRTSNLEGKYLFCTFRNNAADGLYLYTNTSYGTIIDKCLFFGNGTHQLNVQYGFCHVTDCVLHGGLYGIYAGSNNTRQSLYLGNRVTGYSTYGLRMISTTGRNNRLWGYNFVYSDVEGSLNYSTTYTPRRLFLPDGTDTNLYTGTVGYVDAANGNYNLTSDATMRRVPITLPS